MTARPRVLGLCLAVLVMSGAGCTKTMMFSTATKVGLDISQRADQVIDVNFGYDRVEVVSIPAPEDTDAGKDQDTYAVLGIFDLRYGNPWTDQPVVINQFFGTGTAARQMAKDAAFQRFFGEQAARLAPVPAPKGAPK